MNLLSIPGNSGALYKWLDSFGPVKLISCAELDSLSKNEILILPGGNVSGLDGILVKKIKESYQNGCRIFAICGSSQSLFKKTEEEELECLNIYAGSVVRLNHPRIGRFDFQSNWFTGKPYFNHSYAVSVNLTYKSDIFIFDSKGFCLAVKEARIFGVQFHPELSGGVFDKVFSEWIREK